MFFKNVVCLFVGLVIGIRITDIWDYVKLQQQLVVQNCLQTNANDEMEREQQSELEVEQQQRQQQHNEQQIYQLYFDAALTTTKTTATIDTNQQYKQQKEQELQQQFQQQNEQQSAPQLQQQQQQKFSATLSPPAEHLYNTTRVLCWIMTTPEYHLKRALHIKNTWGKRCNKLLFMSTKEDHFLETIKLPVNEGRAYLWDKTRAAFKFVYDNHFHDADWFLKADDDTYFIMENLRAFLQQHDANEPVYFGCKFHPFVKQGYMSGGAGYVLSKESLRRFAEIAYANTTLCSQNIFSEDKEMGICLQNVGVAAGDSRDEMGRERFMPLAPVHLIPVDISEWYARYLFYKRVKNTTCCSPSAISFHYIKPKEFYIMEYLLYHLRPFGAQLIETQKLPTKLHTKSLVTKWRHDLSDNIFKN